jgi:hypothetical protein
MIDRGRPGRAVVRRRPSSGGILGVTMALKRNAEAGPGMLVLRPLIKW